MQAHGSSGDQEKSLELGDRILFELGESIERGSPSLEAELERLGVTHAGDIRGFAELMLFALWPANLAIEHFAADPIAERTRGYVRLALTTILADIAERSGAMRVSRDEFEETWKFLFPRRFDEYATVFNAAVSGNKHRAVATLAVHTISAAGGTPLYDDRATEILETYLFDCLETYQDIVIRIVGPDGST